MEEQVRNWSYRAGAWCIRLLPVGLIAVFFFLPLITWMWSLPGIPRTRHLGVDVQDMFWALFWPTLIVSTAASVFAVIGSSCLACIYVCLGNRLRQMLWFTVTLPLLIGFLARNYSWLGLLQTLSGRDAPRLLATVVQNQLLYQTSGIVLVMGVVLVPIAFFVCVQGFEAVKPEYLQAGQTLGATNFRMFTSVTIPVALRAILLAFATCLVIAVGYFVTPRMIGGGNRDFVGNGVLSVRDEIGDTRGASLLVFRLFMFTGVAVLGLVIPAVRRRVQATGE